MLCCCPAIGDPTLLPSFHERCLPDVREGFSQFSARRAARCCSARCDARVFSILHQREGCACWTAKSRCVTTNYQQPYSPAQVPYALVDQARSGQVARSPGRQVAWLDPRPAGRVEPHLLILSCPSRSRPSIHSCGSRYAHATCRYPWRSAFNSGTSRTSRTSLRAAGRSGALARSCARACAHDVAPRSTIHDRGPSSSHATEHRNTTNHPPPTARGARCSDE